MLASSSCGKPSYAWPFFPCLLGGGSGVDKVKVISRQCSHCEHVRGCHHTLSCIRRYVAFSNATYPSPLPPQKASEYIRRCDGYRKRWRRGGGEAFPPHSLSFPVKKNLEFGSHVGRAQCPASFPSHSHHRRLPKPEGTQNLLFRTSAQKYSSHTARKKRGRNYPSIPAPSHSWLQNSSRRGLTLPPPKKKK